MGSIAIHCNPSVAWQRERAPLMLRGLKELGLEAEISMERERHTDVAVVLGTTFFRQVEATGDYLLVDRASIGDPHWVQLVWNGHGRRGNHCVPANRYDRWKYLDREIHPWNGHGHRVVVCGQTETYSPHYGCLEDWYRQVEGFATHFRHHPAGGNPTGLPLAQGWDKVGRVITLNSSVGVESVLNGIPTVTMDEAAMAWEVTAHQPDMSYRPDRSEWCQWLAWTQWHWTEIAVGEPIRHLFEETY